MNATNSSTAEAPVQSDGIRKVIVAIHGIGDQKRNETIQTATARFCDYCEFPAFTPLGNFPQELGSGVAGFVFTEAPKNSPLRELAFAEVYWAAVPRKVIQDGYLVEEPKKWGRTLIERLRYRVGVDGKDQFNFPMLHQVVPQIIETIYVIERVASVGKAAGLIEISLKKVLEDYLDDVQIVADFPQFRKEILAQFDSLMTHVHKVYPHAEIHLIAHSEGTVVSWLGLLSALSSASPPEWIQNVRGYMTIGSPIDKHLILWPELFRDFEPRATLKQSKIHWRNYYDFGDPVGFELDTARAWMDDHNFNQYFEFDGELHDLGFTRYYLPGKAHNDYWGDNQVFGHFIGQVVKIPGMPAKCAEPPKTKRMAQIVSYAGAYLVPITLLLMGLYLVYKQSGVFLHPVPESGRLILQNVIGIGALLGGLTVLARIPRLVLSLNWQLIAFGIFLLGCGGYRLVTDSDTRNFLGYWPEKLGLDFGINRDVGVVAFSFILGVIMFFLSKKFPKLGMKAIILPAVAGILFLAAHEALTGEAAQAAEMKIWPLLLGAAAFFYLWWLAALIFDLIFVWHRYIRFSGFEHICNAVGMNRAKRGRKR